ncbi:hypothetical protein M427DRAFT_50207 [Gonapodya prolifera JEL478]|uniref:mRNA cap guanine-N(7) methyltransferase n=1 Tax=Gonapodya prolifera (strain JEL478) TaxID=1344416 RepID=A0A138ZWS8_GONPJ|nr:hypothetical protein M427DRAFT_50207 [Gonapodya prolifera JEL478]|eukprot:KXS08911.1 hypothetical protein M427DRAFT_50207 [Gonapodya prolifera JEL478]
MSRITFARDFPTKFEDIVQQNTYKAICGLFDQSHDDQAYELETRFSAMLNPSKQNASGFHANVTPSIFYRILKSFENKQYVRRIRLIYEWKEGTTKRPDLSGIRVMSKERQGQPVDVPEYNFRVALSKEKMIPNSWILTNGGLEQFVPKAIRRKHRIEFVIGNFHYDFTVVTILNDPKDMQNSSATLEIELEYVGNRKSKTCGTSETATSVRANLFKDYIRQIYVLVQMIQDSQLVIPLSESRSVLKDLEFVFGRSEQKHTKNIQLFFPAILPDTIQRSNIVNIKTKPYVVTPKYDGTHVMVIIHNCIVYALDRKHTLRITGLTSQEDAENEMTVMEGELVTEKENGTNVRSLYIFDILVLDGQDLRENTLWDFTKRIAAVSKKLTGIQCMTNLNGEAVSGAMRIKIKPFFKSWTNTSLTELLYPKDENAVPIDGLIFIPETSAYPDRSKYNGLFKWKPLDCQSIDVCIQKREAYANGNHLYLFDLYVQDKTDLIIFEPISNIEVTYDEFMLYPNKSILEIVWDPSTSTFKVHKQRFDKNKANFKTVANEVWNAIMSPVDLADLSGPIDQQSSQPRLVERKIVFGNTVHPQKMPGNDTKKELPWSRGRKTVWSNFVSGGQRNGDYVEIDSYSQYSGDTRVQGFRDMRAFHNAVKNMYITRAVEEASANRGFAKDAVAQRGQFLNLLDLACGRCGDLQKWYKNKIIGSVVGIDVNETSLIEAQRRISAKIEELTASRSNTVYPKISLYKANLLETQVGNVIPRFRPGLFDIVVCNFALHFFATTESNLTNFLDGVATSLRNGGVFLCMLFDGTSVMKAIRNSGGQSYFRRAPIQNSRDDDSHQIEKGFVIQPIQSQEGNADTTPLIKVCVTGDPGNIMESETTEAVVYPVNLIMRAKQVGLEIVHTEKFSHLYQQISGFSLDTVEKDFSFLNQVYLFKRLPRKEWLFLCQKGTCLTTLEERIIGLLKVNQDCIVQRRSDDCLTYLKQILYDIKGISRDDDEVTGAVNSWKDDTLQALANLTDVGIYRYERDGCRKEFNYEPGKSFVIVCDPNIIIGTVEVSQQIGDDIVNPKIVFIKNSQESASQKAIEKGELDASEDEDEDEDEFDDEDADYTNAKGKYKEPAFGVFEEDVRTKSTWADDVEAEENMEREMTKQRTKNNIIIVQNKIIIESTGSDTEDEVEKVQKRPKGDNEVQTQQQQLQDWTIQAMRIYAKERGIVIPVKYKRKTAMFEYLCTI